jgi:pimeloyl-ACP methyl ester carboxylesterase
MTRKIYALLVGIDRYAPPVSGLQGCVNDIEAIETYLKSKVGGEWTLQKPQKLLDRAATRQAIIEGFQQYLTQADSEDIALFYYSGHGGQEKAPQEFWHLEPDRLNETLVCYDSRTPGNHDLADKELKYLLAQVAQKNPRTIVILDCCHSGSGTRNIPQGVRLAPEDRRERDLASFIFAKDTTFSNFFLNSQKVNEKKTGLELPKGRHTLMAACRDYQYAKEYRGDNDEIRGAFSYFLLKSLEQSSGSLSYLDLARNIEALIKGNIQDQVPQLEATNVEDLKELFLGDAFPERPFYFTLSYSQHSSDRGWKIDGGLIQGISQTSAEETTLLAIFPVGSKAEELKQGTKAVGEAEVTKVLTQKSKVEITEGLANLDENQSYWAVVTSLPLEPLKVYLKGAETGIILSQKALETANFGQKSLYIKQVDRSTDADLYLLVQDGQYLITQNINQNELSLVAPLNEAKEAIQALESIARWRNILNLKSPQRSQIKSQNVDLEVKLIGYEAEDGKISQEESDTLNNISNNASELRLEYRYENGQWQPPVIQVSLINHSHEKLYANVIDLAEDYSVAVPFFDERSSVVLPPKTNEGVGVVAGFDDIILAIPDDFLAAGITEYQDILKLIVSKTDFNASLLEQEGLKPPQRGTRGTVGENSLNRLMDRVYTRNAARSQNKYDDWITKEIAVTIVKPRNAETIKSDRSVELLNGLVSVQPHPSLQAKVTLTTVSQTTRDIGDLIAPPALWDEEGIIESFQFTTSRGSDPGLSGIELFEVSDIDSVTKDTPLTVKINQTLAADEYLLPISYDGEFFLPLGYGIPQEKQIEITLERLPQPTTSSRSLGGSIKIFFKKLRHQTLGHIYEYPILATAEVKQVDNKFQVTYQKDLEVVKQQVASAQKIVLYIHGIIGDTESMVTSIQQARVEIDNQLRPLREAYDLVLTFDYENLDTTIEENARLLKQRLESVGLGANHGKQLQIIAHSMGGLVSRWFIEREGGNQIVQHLIMLGTPNAGSPWSTVQDLTFALLGMGLNQISGTILPAKIVADLAATSLQFIEKIDNSLDLMQPNSEFLRSLSLSPDPQIPYTIIAGDRSTLLKQQANILRRLMSKLFTPAINRVIDDLVFGGELNDIAVSLASIKSVKSDRSPQPRILPHVACDHLTYFTTEAGLQALVAALS